MKMALGQRARRMGLGLLSMAGLVVALANGWIISANKDRLATDHRQLPDCEVALVLGTSARLRDGRTNLHFENRMDAASALYHAGKVKHLLVSGDNRTRGYDEPTMMRAALRQRGVPEAAITSDFAGLRTLDSVVRAKEIFEVQRCIIVSQHYHLGRALEIARSLGIDAWGYAAPEVAMRHSLQTEIREVFARVITILDLYLWHRQPQHLGPKEPIVIAYMIILS
jgi:SanA protein